MRLEWEAQWMSLGLPNYCPNPNRQYVFFSGIRVWSSYTSIDPEVIAMGRLATKMTKEDNDGKCPQELEALNEKWLQAQQCIELYQARISKAFNKKVKERVFQKGDLVLVIRWPMVMTHKIKDKFQPKWEGSFVIETVYSNGAYRLATPDGDILMTPVNGKFLKKYYPWSR